MPKKMKKQRMIRMRATKEKKDKDKNKIKQSVKINFGYGYGPIFEFIKSIIVTEKFISSCISFIALKVD